MRDEVRLEVARAVSGGLGDPADPGTAGGTSVPSTSVTSPIPRNPVRFHLASLALAGCLLAWTARGLQFYWDDWAIVAALRRGDFSVGWLLGNHNEHWIMLPKLVFSFLSAMVGFGSVWPYIAVTIALHLVLCHLLWRLMVGGGADPWLAGVASLGFALYAAGVEDILFPIQMALIGSLVLGTLTILELSRLQPRPVVVIVLTTLNVMTFGLAPVFLVLAFVLLLTLHRVRLAWTLAPAAVVFAIWYLVEVPRVVGQARGAGDVALVPLYWLLGIGNAITSIVPWRSPERTILPGLDPSSALLALLGVLLLLVLLAAVSRRPAWRPGWPVLVFMLGTPTMVVVTSLSRISFGLGYAMLSRYTYVGTAFLLPFLVVVVSRMVVRHSVVRPVVLVTASALVAANLVVWPGVAHEWTSGTRRSARTLAAGQQLQQAGAPLLREMAATPEFAFLAPEDLPRLDLSQVEDEVIRADQLSAVLSAQVQMLRGDAVAARCGPVTAALDVPLTTNRAVVRVSAPSTIDLSVVDDHGASSHVRPAKFSAGTYLVISVANDGALALRETRGESLLALCEA